MNERTPAPSASALDIPYWYHESSKPVQETYDSVMIIMRLRREEAPQSQIRESQKDLRFKLSNIPPDDPQHSFISRIANSFLTQYVGDSEDTPAPEGVPKIAYPITEVATVIRKRDELLARLRDAGYEPTYDENAEIVGARPLPQTENSAKRMYESIGDELDITNARVHEERSAELKTQRETAQKAEETRLAAEARLAAQDLERDIEQGFASDVDAAEIERSNFEREHYELAPETALRRKLNDLIGRGKEISEKHLLPKLREMNRQMEQEARDSKVFGSLMKIRQTLLSHNRTILIAAGTAAVASISLAPEVPGTMLAVLLAKKALQAPGVALGVGVPAAAIATAQYQKRGVKNPRLWGTLTGFAIGASASLGFQKIMEWFPLQESTEATSIKLTEPVPDRSISMPQIEEMVPKKEPLLPQLKDTAPVNETVVPRGSNPPQHELKEMPTEPEQASVERRQAPVEIPSVESAFSGFIDTPESAQFQVNPRIGVEKSLELYFFNPDSGVLRELDLSPQEQKQFYQVLYSLCDFRTGTVDFTQFADANVQAHFKSLVLDGSSRQFLNGRMNMLADALAQMSGGDRSAAMDSFLSELGRTFSRK